MLQPEVVRAIWQNAEKRLAYHRAYGDDLVLAVVIIHIEGYWDVGEIEIFRADIAGRLGKQGFLEVLAHYERRGDSYCLIEDGSSASIEVAASEEDATVVATVELHLGGQELADSATSTLAEVGSGAGLVHPLGTRVQAGRLLEGDLRQEDW